MLYVTTEHIPGRKITDTIGVVRGNTIRARHVGSDIIALMKNLVGGEIHEYTKLLAESREQAIDRMLEEADSLGADAVIAVRFSTSAIMGAAAELMVYGTAVRLEPVGEDGPTPNTDPSDHEG
ncbi:MAG: YbjQ family protein [Phycisphaerae bacterium]